MTARESSTSAGREMQRDCEHVYDGGSGSEVRSRDPEVAIVLGKLGRGCFTH